MNVRKVIIALLCALALGACNHSVTGTWEGQLIQGPGTSLEAQKVYLVRDGKRHWVVHSEWLISHGYAWPADVHHIGAAEVNAIPEAEMIADAK
ncbi:MAG: hypothetical protein M3169_12205 [Candidatus Eremiobacteraeota bacterium]|nr:hypothetical protein [Candidatus Eremiobacteraeota bacterium]